MRKVFLRKKGKYFFADVFAENQHGEADEFSPTKDEPVWKAEQQESVMVVCPEAVNLELAMEAIQGHHDRIYKTEDAATW